MTTITHDTAAFADTAERKQSGFTFSKVLSAIFMVNLRESIAATAEGDIADAAFAYGL